MYYLSNDLINKTIKVAVIGVGGTGSFFAQEIVKLTRAMRYLSVDSNLDVTFYDGGAVTEANCIRQNFFLPHIGMNKAEAITWVTNNLHGMDFKSVAKNATPNNLSTYDIIVTCVDIPSIRYQISEYFNSKNNMRTPLWLDCGNAKSSGQILMGETGCYKYLPNICDLYDFSELSDDDGLKKSCSAMESLSKQNLGVNAFAARLAGQLLSNLLLNGKIESHGAYFDCEALTSEPIEINKETWAIYDYTPSYTPS